MERSRALTNGRHVVDVAIVGDGLVGLSVAQHVVARGRTVAVIGSDRAGQASTAAAGMLTPACEYDLWICREFLDLLEAGLAYYPEFIGALGVRPVDVGYRASNFLQIDLPERLDSLRPRVESLTTLGFHCEWLEPAEASEREPAISPVGIRGAIEIRDQAVVNPVALWNTLGAVLDDTGTRRCRDAVVGFANDGERVVVETNGPDRFSAETVVIAAGAWSTEVAYLAGFDLPICPAKGEMIQLRGEPGSLGRVVYMPGGACGAVFERAPGQYVVGTSEEYVDPTPHNTVGVVGEVLHRLCRVVPAAARWTIERMWAGFRPMTSDEIPVIGEMDDARFIAATGHRRNGILLGPLTGRIVADLLDGSSMPGLDLVPFRFGRPLRPFARFASKF